MPFKVRKISSYEWPVKVQVPHNGRFKEETFTGIFKKLSRSAFNDLLEQGDDALVQEIMIGWKGIVDEDGEEIEFSDEALREFADDPFFLRGLITSFTESLTGAQAKN